MRQGVAIVVAGVAIAGAVYFGSLKLDPHGPAHCAARIVLVTCPSYDIRRTSKRATWQIPVAIVIAAVGLGAAVASHAARDLGQFVLLAAP